MHCSGIFYSAVVRSLLLALVFADFVHCSTRTIPNYCLDQRPRSSEASCQNQTRKFFFHPMKLSCKPFGICYEDADRYDLETELNYFQSMEECEDKCPGAVECPTPEPIQNGVYRGGSYGLGDTITYSCSEGYELVGSPNRTCQLLNSSWQGAEPHCQEQCRAPGIVENAVLSPVKSYYSVGSKITYTCNQSHVGGGERICQLNGTWTGPNVTCQYVQCPSVEAITNGVVTEQSRELASNVTYSCSAGYELIGLSVRTCLVNGSWTGRAPYCRAQCSAPPPVANAVVSPQQDYYSVGSRIQYTCSEGYSGDTERECQANASWSGPLPECEVLQIECPDPVPIDNGDVRAPDLRVGAKLMYSCNGNYSLIGNSTRKCTETGEWSGSKPVCARIRLIYRENGEDVTNSTLSLPSGEDEHIISCVTEPATYPGRIAPVWSVMGHDNFPHSVSADGSRLVFRSVFTSREQEAEYMCKSGAQMATVDIAVSSLNKSSCQEPPKLSVPPDTLCAHEGDMAQFHCVLTGCPPPEVRWYHNGTLIETGNQRKRLVTNSFPFSQSQITVCTLSIADVSAIDIGNYQCFGNNTEGSIQSQIVQLKTHVSKRSVSKRSVQQDTRQNPHCSQDPNSVTVVGKVRRSSPRAATQSHPAYRIRVNKVLRGAEAILRGRKLMTVVLPPTQNPTLRLLQDTTYIITGINIDNKLIFADHNLIQTHSNELEDLIQTC